MSIPQLSACNCISGGLSVTGNSFVNFGPLLVANNNLNELTWLGNNLFQTGALFDFPAISQISQTPGNAAQNGILLSGPVGMTANGSGSGGLAFTNWGGTQVASIDLSGNAHFNGNLTVSGIKAFKIDHPLDPVHKYLLHSVVESSDIKNMYDGIVTLDEHGEAEVRLPDWFQALNQDFRYQLTCIGGAGPVYVAQEIQDNRFRVAGGRSGLRVSWQVTGIRHDPSAQANRFAVEEEKPEKPRGH
jgi:hypothetical protein